MAKRTVPIAAADDGRTEYHVVDGVTHINGAKVTGKTLRLTAAEAVYDLSLDRIRRVEVKSGATGEGA